MKRFLLFAIAIVCVSIGAWAGPHDVTQDPNDATKFWIGEMNEGNYFTVVGDVVTFHVAKTNPAGKPEDLINKAWNNISGKINGATRIKFDNACFITQADLEKFLQGNKYYVDLFDITNGTNTPMKIDDYTREDDDNNANNIDKIIEKAVANMVTNNWQAKGIILPLNTGSGTAKVETAINQESKPTFTEYAAYYRANTNPPTVAIYSHYEEMKNGWQNVTSHSVAQQHYETAYSHLTSHGEVEDATTYIVSTNSRIKNSDEPLNLENIKSGVTKISIVNDELVYTANPGDRSLLAFISVEGSTGGDFAAAVQNTNINGTPCEELTVRGPVTSADIAAVNEFNAAADKVGPKVYNLANASVVQKTDLKSITNPHLEFIILPPNLAEQELGKDDFSTALTAGTTFKSAVAASTDKTKLSAYVNVAGSLAKARCYATGNSSSNAGDYKPAKQSLTSVILGGNLNANDIGTTQDGQGLKDENSTITSLDLSKAYFANVNDMRLGNSGNVQVGDQWVQLPGAGFQQKNVLTEVKLPTDSQMKEIPAGCLNGISSLQTLHIPYNYEKIGWEAFWGTSINHITTEDASRALIDNGPNTYTLSANINELGEAGHGEGSAVFPGNQFVTDVYCLAMTTPVCYAHTFHANMVYANGGIYDGVYCRDKYIKYENGQPHNAVTLLHFPSEESYNAATGTKETSYSDLETKYTDPTRDYHKKDQTGAVDANGDPLSWPDQGEVLNTRGMALAGHIWTDYPNMTYQQGGTAHQTGIGSPVGDTQPFYPNYVGWHEFVLSMPTYVDPTEKKEGDKIIREYQEAGWYTFCIPFDMTVKQVREMLGVPKSEGNVICKLYDSKGTLIDDNVSSAIMPDIRQLLSVTRKKGSGSENNVVTFRLTHDLYNEETGITQYLDFTLNAAPENVIGYKDAGTTGTTDVDGVRSLVGGRPYIIKAYKRKGEVISRQNIGQLVMTRFADDFDKKASTVANGLYEQLGPTSGQNANLETLRFAIPFENHKVQAMRDSKTGEPYIEYDDNGTKRKYYYTMVGQFWKQAMPMYCIYMSKGKWYRYSKDKGYEWDPYKCVIMATQEIDEGKGGKYRDDSKSNYPAPKAGTTDLLESDFKLGFLDGRDDDDFENFANSKYMFTFDDEITELDDEGNESTTIRQIDGEDILPVMGTVKVYNMAGQYVGSSLQGLSKGLYVVNGKKYIVK